MPDHSETHGGVAATRSLGTLLRGSVRRWQGRLLCAAALVSTLWLTATNQLILYIHPRYVVFTVIMAVTGLLFIAVSLVWRSGNESGQEHAIASEKRRPVPAILSASATVLTMIIAFALVFVPPATLTSATANQRVINSGQVGANTKTIGAARSASSTASARYTVLDWSSLLRQTTDIGFFSGKPVDVVGFISPATDDPANMFYVSRFVITCCAVDAQPVGVPVYLSNWKTHFAKDGWVHIAGAFTTNPSSRSQQSIALVPSAIDKTRQPGDPYLY